MADMIPVKPILRMGSGIEMCLQHQILHRQMEVEVEDHRVALNGRDRVARNAALLGEVFHGEKDTSFYVDTEWIREHEGLNPTEIAVPDYL